MYKIFTLSAAIAIMPLSQNILSSNIKEDSSFNIPVFLSNIKNTVTPNPFEPEKKATEPWSQNWMATAQENIRKSEYHFTWEEKLKAYCTPNRKNNLRFFYNEKGFSVEPRQVKIPVDKVDKMAGPEDIKYRTIPNWKVRFELDKGLLSQMPSANGKQQMVNENKWQIVNNKAEYITEKITVQYINNYEGMRQNFIVHTPLSKNNELKINFSIKTKLKSKLTGNCLQFFHKKTNVLNYRDLKVWDANNKLLKASFHKKNKGRFYIQVNTKDAVYPITIDPISTGTTGTPDWIGDDADQAGAIFGSSVASAGDVNGDGYSDVIIGAPRFDEGANLDEGRAFVYHGSAAGLSATPSSTPDDADQANAFFGTSVATAGDVNGDGYSDVIIGAYLYDDGAFSNEGRAFVYHGSATGLVTTPSSMPDDCNQVGARFGASVASAGDVNGDGYSDVIIGANLFDDGANTDEGRAFVYYGSATGISASPNSIPDDANQIFAEFGNCVASAGDVNGDGYSDVVIGAFMWDEVPTFTNDGKCFVYHGSAAGLAASPNNTLDATNENNANLGISVACAGDVNGDGYSDIIAGAPGLDDGANFDEGKAFVYFGSAAGASASPGITLDDANQLGASFGSCVASAGDVNGDGFSDVMVGAELYDDTHTNEGVCFIYYGNAAGTMVSPVCTLDDADQNDAAVGSSVASAGDVNGDGYSDVIIGAYFFTDGGNAQEGRAFVYHGSAAGLSASPTNTPNDADQVNASFGISVASAGDINADGYSDVIIGASQFTDGANSNEGRAFLYHGSATGLPGTPNSILDNANQANAQFGISVSSAGDVNGDGYGDVVIGALLYTDGVNGAEGRAFVYHGSAAGLSTTPNSTPDDADQMNANFGVSVACAGDVNGDGYSDIIIGAANFDDGVFTDEGRAYIYYGASTGLSSTPDNIADDADQASAYFGYSVASAGDVNGDGYSDVIIGAYAYNDGFIDEGKVFIYHGSATGISATPNSTPDDIDQANADFGISVSSAGDVNGDGYSDVIIGAYLFDDGINNEEGRALVYHGSVTGLSSSPNSILDDANQSVALFGRSVSSAGDVNGDGYGDVIIGADGFDDGFGDEGKAFVYYGSVTGLSNSPGNTPDDANQASAWFGRSVACAGDVNGDGYSDIIIGAPVYNDGGNTDEGNAYLYNGNEFTTNKRNNLRLYNTDLITPINSSNFLFGNFGTGLYAKSFLGRDKGKLVWETRLNYNTYSGTPITNSTFYTAQQATFTDMGLTGVELKNIINKIWGGKYTKIRARVKYNLVTAVTGQVYGPWRYVSNIIDANHLGVLPIELISFNAGWLQKGKTAKLDFKTDKEYGLCCFDIEKSTDGFNFYSIGTLPAKNTSGIQSYSFIDANATGKKQFYRLKIKGIAGQVDYSNMQYLQNDKATEIIVFPNPATDVLQLQLNKSYDKMNVQIISSEGRVVKKLTVPAFNQIITVPVQNLPAGKYWLHLQSGVEKQVLQFVKQ
ncbi:MAG: FG-GAP repeat protein [Ferruginibacter sp.]|nr:FG-GAP repeat protein [Ferruginibacter sp.]